MSVKQRLKSMEHKKRVVSKNLFPAILSNMLENTRLTDDLIDPVIHGEFLALCKAATLAQQSTHTTPLTLTSS